MSDVKKMVSIQDLSANGRCAQSVVLPVASALGTQVVALPTAVLSAHFGLMKAPTFVDLTDFLTSSLADFKREKLDFHAIYTGFLGSAQQVDICLDFFVAYPDALHLVDPVMGDGGRAYRACTAAHQEKMKQLVAKAHVLLPNWTEVCLLLGEAYEEEVDLTTAQSFVRRLAAMGPRQVVVTGLQFAKGEVCNLGYDGKTDTFFQVRHKKVDAAYPGTGDCFAAIVGACLLQGKALQGAVEVAGNFLAQTIAYTKEAGTDPNHGILLEDNLHLLTDLRQRWRGEK